MAGLLKAFGKGLLYILALPVLIIVLAIYLVVGLVIFVYIGLKGIILFFSGRNLQELPEDIKAREILEALNKEDNDSVQIEETKPEEVKTEPTGFASNYYVPFSGNVPPIKEEPKVENTEENKEGDKEDTIDVH